MMAPLAKVPRAAWFALPLVLGAGILSGVLVLRRGAPDVKLARVADQVVPSKASGSRVEQVLSLLRARSPREKLAQTYGDWAGDPAAVTARKMLLNALFAENNVALKLSAVLAAVEADATPPEQDPLWTHLADSLSQVWQGDVLTRSLDLMFVEERPRAKRALVSSFAHLVRSGRAGELTPMQHQTLTHSFIDMYQTLPPGQKLEVEDAVRILVGNDAADIMTGTLADGHELEYEKEHQRAMAESPQAVARAPESEPPPAAPDSVNEQE